MSGIEYNAWCDICGFRHNRPEGQTEHPTEKVCPSCPGGELQPLSAFKVHTSSWDGHQKLCLQCAAAQGTAKSAMMAQLLARQKEEAAREAAKPLVLVLPDFPQHVDVVWLPERDRKRWVRAEYLICPGCGSALPAEKKRSRNGLAYEEVRPFCPVTYDAEWGWACGDWYCSEVCYAGHERREAPARQHREEEARRAREAFRTTLGVKLAAALDAFPAHCAFNHSEGMFGVYPIVYATRRPDGKIVAVVDMFEGEWEEIVADSPAELDEQLFTDGFGAWDGPDDWEPEMEVLLGEWQMRG
jgi:hypothetical protein